MVNLSQATVETEAVDWPARLLGRRVANGTANLVRVCVVRARTQPALFLFALPSAWASLSHLPDKVKAFSCQHCFTFFLLQMRISCT